MPCYAIDGVVPVVDPSAFVHPTAVLIGDVIIGPNCYVGPGASLRGDFGRIVMGPGANIQDLCIVHGYPKQDTLIEENGHIGHGAVLHSCVVRRGALVGINAVVMDDAEVGEESVVAACSFVPVAMRIAPRTMVAGIPARVRRTLQDKEVGWYAEGTRAYHELTGRCLATMRETPPLPAVETGRPRLPVSKVDALIVDRDRGIR
jgi:phenylacetic acid degradation protein